MSALDEIIAKVLEADERLAAGQAAIDREWERLKQEHNARAGNPLGFSQHLEEMSKQAIDSVKDDPQESVFTVVDQVANAFVKLTSDERAALSDFVADCRQ